MSHVNFGASNPFNKAGSDRTEDTRIQNLAFYTDAVIDSGNDGGGNDGDDTLKGDLEEPGGKDLLFGGKGNDLLFLGDGSDLCVGTR
jgi:Ca2+-binding RTX toxin-like protein